MTAKCSPLSLRQKSPPQNSSALEKTTPDFLQMNDDHSDQKATNRLLNKLFVTSPEVSKTQSSISQSISPKLSKMKQMSLSNYISPGKNSTENTCAIVKENPFSKKKSMRSKKPRQALFPSKNESKGPTGKITKWLTKDDAVSQLNDAIREKKASRKTKAGKKEKSNKQENKDSAGEKTKSEFYAKYGVHVPSFDEILNDQKKYQNYKNCIESINTSDSILETVEIKDITKTPGKVGPSLDCKHLSIKEIEAAFENHFNYIYDIFHGFRYCERHERFKKQNFGKQLTIKDLKYNSSMSVFTFDQKECLLRLFRKSFDEEGKLCKFSQYYFKVLLPEFCIKIFMDTFNMEYQDSVAYLDERPLDSCV